MKVKDNMLRILIKCKCTFFLVLLASALSIGQSPANRFLFSASEIVVNVLPENDVYYSYVLNKGITAHHLAEVFQVPESKLTFTKAKNEIDAKNNVKIVQIPIDVTRIVSQKKEGRGIVFVPIFYIVRAKETMYRISKNYFGLASAIIEKHNQKKNSLVQVGEKLLIGWYPLVAKTTTEAIKKSRDQVKTISVLPVDPPKPKGVEVTDVKTEENQVIKQVQTDIIGLWDKNTTNSNHNFVLHNEAKVGSIMDIYHPMLKKHTKAKVIGRIPLGTYAQEVQIIISPATAKNLGILDTRFMVHVQYTL